jgi:predicted transcriptional regulator
MTYLDELAGAGLVTRDRMPQITSEGRVFLEHYVRWKEILGRYGLG